MAWRQVPPKAELPARGLTPAPCVRLPVVHQLEDEERVFLRKKELPSSWFVLHPGVDAPPDHNPCCFN